MDIAQSVNNVDNTIQQRFRSNNNNHDSCHWRGWKYRGCISEGVHGCATRSYENQVLWSQYQPQSRDLNEQVRGAPKGDLTVVKSVSRVVRLATYIRNIEKIFFFVRLKHKNCVSLKQLTTQSSNFDQRWRKVIFHSFVRKVPFGERSPRAQLNILQNKTTNFPLCSFLVLNISWDWPQKFTLQPKLTQLHLILSQNQITLRNLNCFVLTMFCQPISCLTNQKCSVCHVINVSQSAGETLVV